MRQYFRKILFTFLSLALVGLPASPLLAVEYGKGTLLKGEFAEVFLVTSDQTLRWIPNEETFEALGFSWDDIIVVENVVLHQYKFGESFDVVEAEETLPTAAEIEEKVRQVFADAPIMIEVAYCESNFLQFRSDGSLVISPNGLYYGIFQIDKNIHGEYALSLGMDILTVDGNIAYARHLYDRKGSQPWPACALKNAPIKNNLELGDESPEVKALQEILNQAGYTIAETGPGSPGNETENFGSLTRQAVQKFQCDKNIVCSGDENSTGYGFVGPQTRAALTSYY